MNGLKSGIDRLLNSQGKGDIADYQDAYDDCLWRITTSGREELEKFVLKAWEQPCIDLPIPLMVLMCRLYVLESTEKTPEVANAIQYIGAHCSPGEEEGATRGFFRLDTE